MNKINKFTGWLVVLVLVAVVLTACGPQAAPETTGEEDTATTVATEPDVAEETEGEEEAEAEETAADEPSGGTVTVGLHQEPNVLWGPATGLTVSQETAALLNRPLLMIDENLEYIPALAVEVPSLENGGISEDGLTYTFHLRDDVRWHDGTPFTAADVEFTYQMLVHPDVPVRGRVGWNQITSVETPDDQTIIFNFESVDAAFLDRVSIVTILPQHVLGEVEPADLITHEWFQTNDPGLGPFKFVEWQPGNYILVERNPDFYLEGMPHLDQIILKIITDANTLTNQLETGEIDMRFRMLNDQVEIVEQMPHVRLVSTNATSPWIIWVNNQDPALGETAVRLALNYGFDRIGLTESLLKGLVEPAYDLIPPFSWAYSDDAVEQYAHDPDRARELLDEAGWVDEDGNGIREKDGVELSFDMLNIAGEPERVQILSFIQDQWRDIGIAVNLQNVDVATMWGNALPNGEYDMGYSYTGRYADPADLAQHYLCPEKEPTTNWGRYCNPELDEVLLAAQATVDRDERAALYAEALEMISQDPAYVFVGWRTDHTPINERVEGYRPATGFLEMWNAYEWTVTE